jgi:hypothetical protein
MENECVTVFLDEAGLPHEKKESLKGLKNFIKIKLNN